MAGHISWRGRCADCGDARELANTAQLRAHSGPFFDHWRRQSVAAFGGQLMDARREQE